MIRVFVFTTLALLLSGALGAEAQDTPPEAARLERALSQVTSLRADFVQIRQVALTEETLEAVGFLAFRPPNGFRLAYSQPEVQELVIHEGFLWVVMPVENQAQRYPFTSDAPGNEVFLLFGADDRPLTEVFEVTEEPWGSYPAALRLFPRDPEPGYPLEEIRLVVGEEGFPRKLFFREITGDTVVFSFTRMTRNPKNIEDLLRLRLPEGIEVIDSSPIRESGLPIDTDQ